MFNECLFKNKPVHKYMQHHIRFIVHLTSHPALSVQQNRSMHPNLEHFQMAKGWAFCFYIPQCTQQLDRNNVFFKFLFAEERLTGGRPLMGHDRDPPARRRPAIASSEVLWPGPARAP
jgi:hypothetical protein